LLADAVCHWNQQRYSADIQHHFQAPIAAKTGTMPAYKGLGPDDRHGLEDRRKPAIQLDEEQAIAVREVDATVPPALQDDQLLPERNILCFKSAYLQFDSYDLVQT
jgi:hypothetical protein